MLYYKQHENVVSLLFDTKGKGYIAKMHNVKDMIINSHICSGYTI